jgi:hypothetical protein
MYALEALFTSLTVQLTHAKFCSATYALAARHGLRTSTFKYNQRKKMHLDILFLTEYLSSSSIYCARSYEINSVDIYYQTVNHMPIALKNATK